MIRQTFGVLAFVALIILGIGCDRRPKGVLSDDEMAELLTDMTIAESLQQSSAQRTLSDSARRALGDGILKQHGIDKAVFDSTLLWYGKNLDDYVELYALVDKKIAERMKKSGSALQTADIGDNIWNLPKHYWMTPLASSETLVFELPGESMERGEMLEWSMRLNTMRVADLLLGVDYTDGTSTIQRSSFRGDSRLMLTLMSDTARTPKRIFGTLHIDRASLPAYIDSIALYRLPFDSTKYTGYKFQKIYYGPQKRVKRNDTGEIMLDSIREEASKAKFREAPSEIGTRRPESHVSPERMLHRKDEPGSRPSREMQTKRNHRNNQ